MSTIKPQDAVNLIHQELTIQHEHMVQNIRDCLATGNSADAITNKALLDGICVARSVLMRRFKEAYPEVDIPMPATSMLRFVLDIQPPTEPLRCFLERI